MIQTEDGIHTAQTREIWYPESKILELERKLINQQALDTL